jgi:hypothetical protein|tara:strand:+ start:63 stop:260 length:198 start_codon:yes stop_codon:yes gene_type:complete
MAKDSLLKKNKDKKFSTLKTRLLTMHPSDMRNSELSRLKNYIREDEDFAKAWKESTPTIKKSLLK